MSAIATSVKSARGASCARLRTLMSRYFSTVGKRARLRNRRRLLDLPYRRIDIGRLARSHRHTRWELDHSGPSRSEVIHGAQLEQGDADQQLVAGVEPRRAFKLVLIDERAVGRLQVLDRGRPVGRGSYAGVLTRYLSVLEHEVRPGIATDHDRAIDRDLLARIRSLNHFEVDLARHGREHIVQAGVRATAPRQTGGCLMNALETAPSDPCARDAVRLGCAPCQRQHHETQ